jgi:hypothetical protein
MDVNFIRSSQAAASSLQKWSIPNTSIPEFTAKGPNDSYVKLSLDHINTSEQALAFPFSTTANVLLPVDKKQAELPSCSFNETFSTSNSTPTFIGDLLHCKMVDPEPRIDVNPTNFLTTLLSAGTFTTETTWIDPIAKVDPKTMSPIGGLLSWNPNDVVGLLNEKEAEIAKLAVRTRNFSSAYKSAVSETRTDGQGKSISVPRRNAWKHLRDLEKFVLDGQRPQGWTPAGRPSTSGLDALLSQEPPKNVRPEEMTALMQGYQDVGAFADVVRVYETCRSRDKSLAEYDIPRENYIVALNRLGSTYIKQSIRESESLLADHFVPNQLSLASRTTDGQRRLHRNLGVNSQLLNSLGKGYRNLAVNAESQVLEMARKQDFAKFVSDFTAVPLGSFKIGDQTAGQIGEQRASERFLNRLQVLAERNLPEGSEERRQNDLDIVSWLESKSGVSAEQWPGKPSPEVAAHLLRETENPIETAAAICGREFPCWEITTSETRSVASEPFVKWAVRAASGLDPKSLTGLAEIATGKKMQGFVVDSAVEAKVSSLRQQVTTQGVIDPELAELVIKKTGVSPGKNLLNLSKQATEIARDYYQSGFGIDFDYLPGLNLLYCEAALGNHETVKGLIPLIQHAADREGGKSTSDYFNLATQTELAAIDNKPEAVFELLPRVLRSPKVAWQMETTLQGLEKMSELQAAQGREHALLDHVAEKFRQRIAGGFPPKNGFNLEQFILEAQMELGLNLSCPLTDRPLSPEVEKRRYASQMILKKSKNFNEAFKSKFVGGSWAHTSKGGVSDTVINRPTVTALRHINHFLGFDSLKSPDQFPAVASELHKYIDAKFGLVDAKGDRPMEDLQSQVHKNRDAFTENRHELCRSRVSGSSRTNLLTEIALGQSDCRHTAATFQACADLWKRDNQTRQLQSCLDAVYSGDKQGYQEAFERAQSWNKFQVVTMDLAFKADVQLESDANGTPQKYALVHDQQGRFVRTVDGQLAKDPSTGKSVALEDHTMPFVLQFADDGETIESMRAVDPFYRQTWNVGDVEVNPLDILDEEKGFHLGSKGTVASDGKPIELYGTPCSYSGLPLGSFPGECGQVTLGGLEFSLENLDSLLCLRPKLQAFTDAVTKLGKTT